MVCLAAAPSEDVEVGFPFSSVLVDTAVETVVLPTVVAKVVESFETVLTMAEVETAVLLELPKLPVPKRVVVSSPLVWVETGVADASEV